MNTSIFKSISLVLAALPFFMDAQTSKVDQFFIKYSQLEGYTSVEITKGLFELFTEIDADDPDFEDFQKAVSGLESLKLLSCSSEDGNAGLKAKFQSDVKSSIPFSEYKELMVVKDKDANINFYAKNSNQIITEMLMSVDGPDEAVLLYLKGNIDLNRIAKLAKAINLEGMNHLGVIKPGNKR
jgi:hypothetical protein